jgi:hypothetical protein
LAEHRTLPNGLTRHLEPRADVEIIREAADAITQALERLHRAPFKFRMGTDCSFVFVTRIREGGAHG